MADTRSSQILAGVHMIPTSLILLSFLSTATITGQQPPMDPSLGVDFSSTVLKGILVIQGATLISIIAYGYRVVRFFNNIEFKTDLMWKDYESRMNAVHHGHRRSSDGAHGDEDE